MARYLITKISILVKTINYIMNKQIFFWVGLLIVTSLTAQVVQKSDALFKNQSPLKIKLSYSNDVIRLETDDTTLVKTTMSFWNEDKWNDL